MSHRVWTVFTKHLVFKAMQSFRRPKCEEAAGIGDEDVYEFVPKKRDPETQAALGESEDTQFSASNQRLDFLHRGRVPMLRFKGIYHYSMFVNRCHRLQAARRSSYPFFVAL